METLVIAWQGRNGQIYVMLWPGGTPQILTSFVTSFAPATATCGGTTYLAWCARALATWLGRSLRTASLSPPKCLRPPTV
jgi:hypothetical protein